MSRRTKGFLRIVKDKKGEVRLVGTERMDSDGPYHGPTARITVDDDWLHIVTDDYEGHATIGIEALPHLRKALTQIAKSLKAKA